MILIGLSATAFGLTFPAYASSIPVIGDIFRFLDIESSGLYDNYKEYSSELNLTQESKGIEVTINEAIFDGESVSVTYTIDSDQDLGDSPLLNTDLKIKGFKLKASNSRIRKVSDHQYVGVINSSFYDMNENNVNVQWNIKHVNVRIGDRKESIQVTGTLCLL